MAQAGLKLAPIHAWAVLSPDPGGRAWKAYERGVKSHLLVQPYVMGHDRMKEGDGKGSRKPRRATNPCDRRGQAWPLLYRQLH